MKKATQVQAIGTVGLVLFGTGMALFSLRAALVAVGVVFIAVAIAGARK